MDYIQDQLDRIKVARRNRLRLINIEGGLLLSSFIFFFIPVVSTIFFLSSCILWYKKALKVARIPCPKCAKPFGSNSTIVLTVGGDKCQNCGLDLVLNKN